MPPKRKQRQDDIVSGSEPEIVMERGLDVAASAKLLEKIEIFKAQRDEDRKDIAAGFDEHVAKTKEAIANHYASQAGKRALLTRYAKALEQRASIERSIEELLSKSREDTEDLLVVLEAAQIGRHRKVSNANGSFAFLVPKGTTSALTMTPSSTMDKRTFDMLSEARDNGRQKEGRAHDGNYAGDAKHKNEERGKENVFGEILW
ncbi:hypothetical protein F4824DRAFT_495003 [Ustulina deusta]|nr:hypothetical protein F4824DRAFT_495003 [Ustulina deusta]